MKNQTPKLNQYMVSIHRPSYKGQKEYSRLECVFIKAKDEDSAVRSREVSDKVKKMYGKKLIASVECSDDNYQLSTTCYCDDIWTITKNKAVIND
jgi:hypothetical protein